MWKLIREGIPLQSPNCTLFFPVPCPTANMMNFDNSRNTTDGQDSRTDGRSRTSRKALRVVVKCWVGGTPRLRVIIASPPHQSLPASRLTNLMK